MSDKWMIEISDEDWKARCDKARDHGHFYDAYIASEYRKILKSEKKAKIWGLASIGVILTIVIIITAFAL